MPSTWTFYADVRTRAGTVRRIEFDVLEDRSKISDQELGRRITATMDLLKRGRLVPAGALRNGVYRGFNHLLSNRALKYRHRGVVNYDINRHYHRGGESE